MNLLCFDIFILFVCMCVCVQNCSRSRLGCQLKIDESWSGVTVTLPKEVNNVMPE